MDRKSTMEIVRIDRRGEARTSSDLQLLVWGIHTQGERFAEQVWAENISVIGALLRGLHAALNPGDVVGILCAGRKARFRVIWVRYDGLDSPGQAAVHRIDQDVCPWLELLTKAQTHEPDPLAMRE